MGTRDIDSQSFPSRNDVEPTDPADDMTYWVGAMTDYKDPFSSADTVDQAPEIEAATPAV